MSTDLHVMEAPLHVPALLHGWLIDPRFHVQQYLQCQEPREIQGRYSDGGSQLSFGLLPPPIIN
jgi:hypothetical protein